MEFHPIANIFPLIDEAELEELADDIRQIPIYQYIYQTGKVKMKIWDSISYGKEYKWSYFQDHDQLH